METISRLPQLQFCIQVARWSVIVSLNIIWFVLELRQIIIKQCTTIKFKSPLYSSPQYNLHSQMVLHTLEDHPFAIFLDCVIEFNHWKHNYLLNKLSSSSVLSTAGEGGGGCRSVNNHWQSRESKWMGFQKLMSRPHESLVATNHGQPHHNKSNRAVTIYQNDITGVVALCIAGDIARCSHVAKTLIFHCGNSPPS